MTRVPVFCSRKEGVKWETVPLPFQEKRKTGRYAGEEPWTWRLAERLPVKFCNLPKPVFCAKNRNSSMNLILLL